VAGREVVKPGLASACGRGIGSEQYFALLVF